jgi:hypothetical protein
VSIKTLRRRPTDRKALVEFRAAVVRTLLSTNITAPAFAAEFCQVVTACGLSTLPPTITFRPVVDYEPEIFRLIERDDLKGVQWLLQSGESLLQASDTHGRTALHVAAWNAKPEFCAILIAAGADVDALSHSRLSPLALCCGIGCQQKLRLLLEAGADPTLLPGGQFSFAQMGADAIRSALRISGV